MTSPAYDEFGLLKENASEFEIPWRDPAVDRREVGLSDGRSVSAVVWGAGPPELVLIHGGAQNAHTWDTVALALDRPLVAIDLPGHGHSSWKDDGDYGPQSMAADVAVAMAELAPAADVLVGMSLGGLTSIPLAAAHPELVRRLVLVDVTPGVNREKASAVIAFTSGPERFASFDEILDRTVKYNPQRSLSSLRRGVLHNAREEADGSWVWRYDRRRREGGRPDLGVLWDDLSAVGVPLLLVRGGDSPVVDDDDVAELRRRQPSARVEVVAGAGHSIQGDKPLELARILEEFVGPQG